MLLILAAIKAKSAKELLTRYNIATVGTIIKSIFSLSLRSATGSNWNNGWPYLSDC